MRFVDRPRLALAAGLESAAAYPGTTPASSDGSAEWAWHDDAMLARHTCLGLSLTCALTHAGLAAQDAIDQAIAATRATT